jgi:diacylglycerol kinase (ATP)
MHMSTWPARHPSRIGLIVSPASGKNRNTESPLAPFLAFRTEVSGAPTTLPALKALITQFRDAGVGTIAVAGGDGSLHLAITAAVEVYGAGERDEDVASKLPRFALLRGGTMNTVANALRSPSGSQTELLARLCSGSYSGADEMTRRRTLHVGDEYGFLFGTGAISGFLEEYYRKRVPSPLHAAKTLVRGALSALVGGATAARITEPFEGTLMLGDTFAEAFEPLAQQRFVAIAAGTVDQIGLGFQPFFRASLDAFHLLAIHTSAAGLALELPTIRLGKSMQSSRCTQHVGSFARLTANAGSFVYMLDGDLRTAGAALEVGLGPTVEFVVGF